MTCIGDFMVLFFTTPPCWLLTYGHSIVYATLNTIISILLAKANHLSLHTMLMILTTCFYLV